MHEKKITYRDWQIEMAAAAISCLSDAIDDSIRMSSEWFAVGRLENAAATARALLNGEPNSDLVEGRPAPDIDPVLKGEVK